MKVFLGGTITSDWRTYLMPYLDDIGVDYFNPIVEDWTPQCQIEEEWQKLEECDVHLYLISPKMKGLYSIAETIDSCANGVITIFAYTVCDGETSFDTAQVKSLDAIGSMVESYDQIFVSALNVPALLTKVKEEITQCL